MKKRKKREPTISDVLKKMAKHDRDIKRILLGRKR